LILVFFPVDKGFLFPVNRDKAISVFYILFDYTANILQNFAGTGKNPGQKQRLQPYPYSLSTTFNITILVHWYYNFRNDIALIAKMTKPNKIKASVIVSIKKECDLSITLPQNVFIIALFFY